MDERIDTIREDLKLWTPGLYPSRKLTELQTAAKERVLAALPSIESDIHELIEHRALIKQFGDVFRSPRLESGEGREAADRIIRGWAHYFAMKACDAPPDIPPVDQLRAETISYATRHGLIDREKIFPIYQALATAAPQEGK